MKRLLLLRHAKAEPHVALGGPLGDHDRALANRGRREAKTIGRFVALAGQAPGIACCSTAQRCRETVELAAKAGRWKLTVTHPDALYGGSAAAYLAVAREAPNEHTTLLVCGHEPTISELASELLGGGSLRVAPGTLIAIDFEIDHWRDLAYGGGLLVWLVPPRLLTEGRFDFATD